MVLEVNEWKKSQAMQTVKINKKAGRDINHINQISRQNVLLKTKQEFHFSESINS